MKGHARKITKDQITSGKELLIITSNDYGDIFVTHCLVLSIDSKDPLDGHLKITMQLPNNDKEGCEIWGYETIFEVGYQ